ncbi:serine-rich adhesin for platelets-like, partial [Trifolium medium]|nr:serine-rich adhesin for platelets-like [Trifolium medium]
MQCKSTVSNSKLVDSTFIKSEPSHEGSRERSKTAESTNTYQLDKVLPQMSFSSSMAVPVMNSTQAFAEAAHSAVKPVCTTVLTTNKNIVGQLKNCSRAEGVNVEKVCEVPSNSEHVPLVTVAIPMVDTATELTNLGLKYSSIVAKK